MSEESHDSLTFAPYFSRKFPLSDMQTEGSRLKGTLHLSVKGKNSAEINEDAADSFVEVKTSFEVTIYGPGDVQGINPNAIARVEPPPGTQDFEPNYFPFMEFRDPDFLWRYSLGPSDEDENHQQPWLSLLVLSLEELSALSTPNAPAFVQIDGEWQLTIDTNFFKSDVSQTRDDWATGHMQLSNYSDLTNPHIQEFIQDFPEQNCSRLFCFRKLHPETSYMLFLVPYYLAGAKTSDEAGKSSIFDKEGKVTLPVYYHSHFMTSEMGDFEFLARRLTFTTSQLNVGTSPVDASPNLDATAVPIEQRAFFREGALASIGYSKALRTKYEDQIENQSWTTSLFHQLSKHFKNPGEGDSDEETPLVNLPYYGKLYQKTKFRDFDVWENSKTPQHWSEELNLDSRNRISAGLGTRVIQKKQEDYLKECWTQVGDLRLANEKVKRAQSGVDLAESLHRRYLSGLSDEKFTLLTYPFHSHFSYKEWGGSSSLKKRLNESGLSNGLLQPTLFRMSRHQFPKLNPPLFDTWKKNRIKNVRSRKFNRNFDDFYRRVKNELYLALPVDRGEILPPKIEIIQVKPINIRSNLRPKFNVKKVMFTKMESLIHPNDPEKKITPNLDPIIVTPVISEAMYRPLKALSLDYILPRVKEIPMNSISLFEENRYFIESYLCGLNDEMGKELLWNQFPLDQRGTIFSHFWDPADVETGEFDELGNSRPIRDVRPLHKWNSLGSNYAEAIGNVGERIVLLIKGDLIRRYPDTVFFALEGTQSYSDNQGSEGFTVKLPAFRAQLGPDILAIGFPFTLNDIKEEGKEYYFILQEQQDLPRFGLDIGSRELRTPSTEPPSSERNFSSDPTWDDVILENNKGCAFNISKIISSSDPVDAGMIAQATLQKPIQIVAHASHMIQELDS